MSRLALFIFALLAFVTLTFASPVPVEDREIVDIAKRSVGRVTSCLFPSYHILIILFLATRALGIIRVRHIYYILTRGLTLVLGLGNCGGYNTNNDLVLAISKALYDEDGGSNCYQVTFSFVTSLSKSLLIFYRRLPSPTMAKRRMGRSWIAVNPVDQTTLVRPCKYMAWPLTNLYHNQTCPLAFFHLLLRFQTVLSRSPGIW